MNENMSESSLDENYFQTEVNNIRLKGIESKFQKNKRTFNEKNYNTKNEETDFNLTSSLMRFTLTISKLLKSTEGRNKICGLIQYISKFSAACIIYTIDTTDIKNNIDIIEMIYNRHMSIKRIEKSMSNGRKIFSFLKFIEDLKKFINIIYDSSFDFETVLKAFISLSGCFYHFLDNLVWASKMGMINKVFTGEINWKTSKNFFSIIRTLIKLFTAFMEFKNCYYTSWINNDNEIVNENYDKIINETIKNRSKLRMLCIDIIQNILKMTTLIYSSKMQPFYSLLHPIIVSFCGILFCCISIFKIYMKINDMQKKMLIDFKKSQDNLISGNNLNGFLNDKTNKVGRFSDKGLKHVNIIQSSSFNFNVNNYGNKIKSFEFSLIDRVPNQKIINDEHYFDNYYIDFNKDFPIFPEMVLKANGGDFRNII